MPSALSESCMKFRLETLAPSGGWLASVAIGLSVKSGIYEYTILAIIFMISFIILRTASCETAMVLALAYDLVIPFQYQNVQRHTAELEKYWPKFLLGCAIEAGCYLLCHPDLFNLAVIIKTSILLIVWMKGKKQYPLNLAKDRQPPPVVQLTSTARDPNQPSPSSSDVTPEYLDYVMKELKKCTGENAVTKERAEEHKANLKKKSSSESRQNTELSLKKRQIMPFKDWKAAHGGGGQGGVSTQGGAQQTGAGGAAGTQPQTGNQPQAANHTQAQTPAGSQPQTGNQTQGANQPQNQTPPSPPAPKYQFTKPTDADIEKLKLDLAAKKSSYVTQPEKVTVPLLAGPDHPAFAEMLNYLRYKGINTRKWVPMVPADRTMYRVQDRYIDHGVEYIDAMQVEKRPEPVKLLKGSYSTEDAFKTAMAKLKVLCGNRLSIKPDVATQDVKVTPHGEPWYDYLQKIQAAKLEGPEEISRVETLYDYLNDPFNRPAPKESSQKSQWWRIKEREWDQIDLLHTRFEDNDWYPGTAGIPVQEIAEYRLKLDQAGMLSNGIKNAIISAVKNHSNADQGRALIPPILSKITGEGSLKRSDEVVKEWQPKTRDAMAHAEEEKAYKEARAAEKAEEEAEAAEKAKKEAEAARAAAASG